jgi:hypothetical protein
MTVGELVRMLEKQGNEPRLIWQRRGPISKEKCIVDFVGHNADGNAPVSST